MLQSILVCLWQLLINTNGCQHRDNSSSAFKLWDNLITQAAGEPTLNLFTHVIMYYSLTGMAYNAKASI